MREHLLYIEFSLSSLPRAIKAFLSTTQSTSIRMVFSTLWHFSSKFTFSYKCSRLCIMAPVDVWAQYQPRCTLCSWSSGQLAVSQTQGTLTCFIFLWCHSNLFKVQFSNSVQPPSTLTIMLPSTPDIPAAFLAQHVARMAIIILWKLLYTHSITGSLPASIMPFPLYILPHFPPCWLASSWYSIHL